MYRLLMIAVAANAIAFGVANLLLPDVVLSILGGEVDALGRSILQILGGTILGYGIAAWFLRDLNAGPTRSGVMIGVIVSFASVSVVVSLAALSALLNALAWGIVAFHAVVAIGLLIVLVGRPARASNT